MARQPHPCCGAGSVPYSSDYNRSSLASVGCPVVGRARRPSKSARPREHSPVDHTTTPRHQPQPPRPLSPQYRHNGLVRHHPSQEVPGAHLYVKYQAPHPPVPLRAPSSHHSPHGRASRIRHYQMFNMEIIMLTKCPTVKPLGPFFIAGMPTSTAHKCDVADGLRTPPSPPTLSSLRAYTDLTFPTIGAIIFYGINSAQNKMMQCMSICPAMDRQCASPLLLFAHVENTIS